MLLTIQHSAIYFPSGRQTLFRHADLIVTSSVAFTSQLHNCIRGVKSSCADAYVTPWMPVKHTFQNVIRILCTANTMMPNVYIINVAYTNTIWICMKEVNIIMQWLQRIFSPRIGNYWVRRMFWLAGRRDVFEAGNAYTARRVKTKITTTTTRHK